MRRLRPALLTATALIAAGIAATAAKADGPTITPVSLHLTTPIPFGVNCGTFSILWTGDFAGTNITFYDDQNQLVRQIRHGSFTGTLYNSSNLSKSVPYDGSFTRRYDAATNTVTIEGLRFRVQLPGQGTVAIDPGQTVFDGLGPATVSDTGPTASEFDATVCGLLS
jgi:hypothetical protein